MTQGRAAVPPQAALAALAALATVVGSCGRQPAPRWIDLADDFTPRRELDLERVWGGGDEDLALSQEEGERRAWVATHIGDEEWRPTPWPDVWRALRPVVGYAQSSSAPGSPSATATPRLTLGGAPLEYLDMSDVDFQHTEEYRSGIFGLFEGCVYAHLEPGARPADGTLEVPVGRGRSVDGRWRLTMDHLTGAGLPVWPGQAVDVETDWRGPARLAFTTVARPVLASAEPQHLTFRVRQGGRLLFEGEQVLGLRTTFEHRDVRIPDAGAGPLRFEVTGPPAVSAFMLPRLGPAAIGDYPDRPWGARRPDVVLFLADTFRADNLALYGGTLGLTPHLDAFAGECVRFARAWAPASWTLPSHATMFTGLAPHQHGAVSMDAALGSGAHTLAEALRDAGYRTAAVTEAGFVSRTFGLDQGFEWFDERERALDETLGEARRLIEADDGRPLFLFVHTYRAHSPYHVSAETRARLGDRISFEGDLAQELARVNANPWGWRGGEPLPDELHGIMDFMGRMYRGGAADLDRGFGDFLGVLEDAGLLSGGYLVFTSDHGEAFGEHDTIWHGSGVWEEQIRIPLLVHGPDLEPRTVERSAGLGDLPRTIAELTDVAWPGQEGTRALLGPGWKSARVAPDRAIFSFQCATDTDEGCAALMRGDRKVQLLDERASFEAADGSGVRAAFDLAADPGERVDLAGEAWPAELVREAAPRAARLYEPLLQTERAFLQSSERARLVKLGYAGK